jgi:FAD/FMN-containing dehydrogenase
MPLFKRPESDFIMGFGILPGVPKDLLDQAIPRLNMASELSEALGGKRYLSGIVQFAKEHWKEHYDNVWAEMKRMKKKYDPNGILNPGFIDYSV